MGKIRCLMQTMRIKIDDLFQFDDESRPTGILDAEALTPIVLKQFYFLPQPLVVTVEGEDVILHFPEQQPAANSEAKRLAQKASRRAAEGNYQKAINIYRRVLELQPAFHEARRDLAMAYVETGDVSNATNHLIELLRLRPQDPWGWVVLGNLYAREKKDLDTGKKFIEKALEIAPNDAWALNSLAAIQHERGESDKAKATFEKAIEANPDFANPYYGLAVVFQNLGEEQSASETLSRLFTHAKRQDARSQPVFDSARGMYRDLQSSLAHRNLSTAFKVVEDYKAEAARLSGYAIRVEETEFEDQLGATIQMAWKHGRDHHVIKTRRGYDAELLAHLESHELTHLKMESEARRAGKNRWFVTTAETREAAIRSVAKDIRKLQKDGYSEESITRVTLTVVNGLSGFLFNCPLDMLIERELRQSFPALRPAQYLSVSLMAAEAAATNTNKHIQRLTPPKILAASLSLNGTYALFLDDLFEGATDFSTVYRRTSAFSLSRKLYEHWKLHSSDLSPGGEYDLVDDFANMLGLREWYDWKADSAEPSSPRARTGEETREGATNPELLRKKHPSSVFYLLDALRRFDGMSPEQVRNVAFEIALKGREGLDYSASEKQYDLKAIPGHKFTGLHLMCLMYAGFQRVAPEQDLGMDLQEPFLTALQLHEAEEKQS